MADVESTLAGLEQRLRELQDDLDADADAAGEPPRTVAPPAAEPRPMVAPPAAEPSSTVAPPGSDPLDRFGDELRSATAALLAGYDRALAEVRGTAGPLLFSAGVAVEAQTDLDGLCALRRALGAVGGVQAVTLRAYAAGRATLDVALNRPVALVEELRGTGEVSFAVLEAAPGRLAVDARAPGAARAGPDR